MNTEMLKGHLDGLVLAALEAEPIHGYAIIEAIKSRSSETFDLPEGTVYPALHRLEKAGLLKSDWITPESGRKRRVYELTRSGRESLAARRRDWSSFATAVQAAIGEDKPWPG